MSVSEKSIEQLVNELYDIGPKKEWMDNIKRQGDRNNSLYQIIGKDYIKNYGKNGNTVNDKAKFTPPEIIPSNNKDLSIIDWARWIFIHQNDWQYAGCKHANKSKEWVTAIDRDTGKKITNQKLLRDHDWEELSENQLFLVRGTIEPFKFYLMSTGMKG
jgi:hypothetical protein